MPLIATIRGGVGGLPDSVGSALIASSTRAFSEKTRRPARESCPDRARVLEGHRRSTRSWPGRLILQLPFLAGEIRERQPNMTLALIGGVVHGGHERLSRRALPG